MDPLSFTASLIAVVTAVGQVVQTLEELRTALREASSTLCLVANEISDLRIVLVACECAVKELHANSTDHELPTALADAASLFDKTTRLLKDLENAVRSCFKLPDTEDGKTRVVKFRWLREKGKIRSLQNALREAKQDIIVLMESHSLSAISGIEVGVQQIRLGAEKHQSESAEKLDHIINTLFSQRTRINSLVTSTSLINNKLDRLSLTAASSNAGAPPPPYHGGRPYSNDNNSTMTDVTSTSAAEEEGMIQIRASCYRRTCRPWCSCCCHVRRSIRTPGVVRNFMGSLFLGYSGVPGITQPCNETQCRRRSSTRLVLSYHFPEWFWTRALFASFAKSTMVGPEMLLRVQTTIPYASETYNFCANGNAKALQRLFEEGLASPFDVDPRGVSLLHNALRFDHYSTCRLLISCGSDLYLEDHTGYSAFHYAWDAILSDPKNTIRKQALLELFLVDEGGLDERQFSRIHKCVLGIIGSSLRDELTISTSSINDPDNMGRTPLFWAARRGDEDAVRLLLEFGAKQVTTRGNTNTPLHAAAEAGHAGIVRKLLQHGADINAHGAKGSTPLFGAASASDGNPCVRVLLEHGADVDLENDDNQSPFFNAIQYAMLLNATKLLEYSANINHRDGDGWSSLASVVFWNVHESIVFLLENEADYTTRLHEGGTLLHIAARYADLETLEILTEAGMYDLDPDALDGTGRTALEISEERKEETEEWHDSFKGLMESIQKNCSFAVNESSERFLVREEFMGKEKSDSRLLEKFVELSDDESENLVFEDALDVI